MRVIARNNKKSLSMVTSAVLSAALGLALLGGSADAWGGLFNRFNPSMLSNLGYGSSYGSKLYNVQEKSHVSAGKGTQKIEDWKWEFLGR